jgi:nitroreductase
MRCIYCGHCFAICPEQAISFQPAPIGDKQGKKWAECAPIAYPDAILDEDKIKDFLYSVRADRLYSPKPVEKEKIEKVVDAMMRASCAGNEQNKHYYIFTDSTKIKEIESLQKQYYARLLKIYDNPLAKKMAALSLSLSSKEKEIPFKQRYNANLKILSESSVFDNSNLSYLKGASALIIITYDNKSGMHKSFYKGDARIAGTYGILMAKALGLASCWMGLLEIAAEKDKKIYAALNIENGEKIGSSFVLGYSDTKWVQYPPRGPAKIVWQ